MYNKNQFHKLNDKKVLRKVRSRWVTISIALLSVIGGAAVSGRINAKAATVPHGVQANHQLSGYSAPRSAATLITAPSQRHHSIHNLVSSSAGSALSFKSPAQSSSRPFMARDYNQASSSSVSAADRDASQVQLRVFYTDPQEKHRDFKPLKLNWNPLYLTNRAIADLQNRESYEGALNQIKDGIMQIMEPPKNGYYPDGISQVHIDKEENEIQMTVGRHRVSLGQIANAASPIEVDYFDNTNHQLLSKKQGLNVQGLKRLLLEQDAQRLNAYLQPSDAYHYQNVESISFNHKTGWNLQLNVEKATDPEDKRQIQHDWSAFAADSQGVASAAANSDVRDDPSVASQLGGDIQMINRIGASLSEDASDLNDRAIANASLGRQSADAAESNARQLTSVAAGYVRSSASVSASLSSVAQQSLSSASERVASQAAIVAQNDQMNWTQASSVVDSAVPAAGTLRSLAAANFNDQLEQIDSSAAVRLGTLHSDQKQVRSIHAQVTADLNKASLLSRQRQPASAESVTSAASSAEAVMPGMLTQVQGLTAQLISAAHQAQQVVQSFSNVRNQIVIYYDDAETHQSMGTQTVNQVDLNQWIHQAFIHMVNNDAAGLERDDQYAHRLLAHVPDGYWPAGIQDVQIDGDRSVMTLEVSRHGTTSLTDLINRLKPTIIRDQDPDATDHKIFRSRSIPNHDLKRQLLNPGTLDNDLRSVSGYHFAGLARAEVMDGQPIVTLNFQRNPQPTPPAPNSSSADRSAIQNDLSGIASYNTVIDNDSATSAVQADGDVASAMDSDVKAVSNDESAASADEEDPDSAAVANANAADSEASSVAANANGLVAAASSYVQSSASASASRSASLSTSASLSSRASASQSVSASLSASSSASASTSASLSASISASASASVSASVSSSASVKTSASVVASANLSQAAAAMQSLANVNHGMSADDQNAAQDGSVLSSLADQFAGRLSAAQKTSLVNQLSNYIGRIQAASAAVATEDGRINGQVAAASSADAAGRYQQTDEDTAQVNREIPSLEQAAASGSSLTVKLKRGYNTVLQYLNQNVMRIVAVPCKVNGRDAGVQSITVNGKIGSTVQLTPAMFKDRSGDRKTVTGSVMIELTGYRLNPGAAVDYTSITPSRLVRFQVTFVDQRGHRFTESFSGRYGQTGSDVTQWAKVPAGYHLNPGQSTAYQLTVAHRSMTLGITGDPANQQQNAVTLNLIAAGANGQILYRRTPIIHVGGRIGDNYRLSAADYTPAGFAVQGQQMATGTITAQGTRPHQVTFRYRQKTPAVPQILQRWVQVPVYTDGVASGTQSVSVRGTVGSVIVLTDDLANNRRGYFKSVRGTVSIDKDRDVVNGQFDYTKANPQPVPQPRPNSNSAGSSDVPASGHPSSGPNVYPINPISSGSSASSSGGVHNYAPANSYTPSSNSSGGYPSDYQPGSNVSSGGSAGSAANNHRPASAPDSGSTVNSSPSDRASGLASNSNPASGSSSSSVASGSSSSASSAGQNSVPSSEATPSAGGEPAHGGNGSTGSAADTNGNQPARGVVTANGQSSSQHGQLPQTGDRRVVQLAAWLLSLDASLLALGIAVNRRRHN